MADERFALFVSCVEGQPFTRYGTRTLIGAERRRLEPTIIDYQPELVVGITHAEFGKYRREYQRGLSNGGLKRRSEQDWIAQNQREGTPSAPENAAAVVAAAAPSAGDINADSRRSP